MVVSKRACAQGSSRRGRTDRRAHFGEERIPSPKKKKKKKKTQKFLRNNDQPVLKNFFSPTQKNNNVVSWDLISVDESGASMEPSNNSPAQSLDTFEEDSASEHSPTQEEIDVEN